MEINGPSSNRQVLLMVLIGLGMVGYGGYSHMVASSNLSSSIMVNGTIESTGVDRDPGRRGTDYRPEVSYSFSYNGSEHTNDDIYPSGITRDYDFSYEAEDEIEEYEEGENVTVYFSPGYPDQAFLRHESTNRPYIMMAAGASFAVLGVVFSIFGS